MALIEKPAINEVDLFVEWFRNDPEGVTVNSVWKYIEFSVEHVVVLNVLYISVDIYCLIY